MDRTPEPNRTAATSSASPTVQQSPFSSFLSNLSPLNTAATLSYSQRLFGSNLPTTPVVFTSPHINLQRENSFLERDDGVEAGSDVYNECNTSIVQNPHYEDVQLCSPSGCVDEYLADPGEADCANQQPTNEVPRLVHSGFSPGKGFNTEVDGVISRSKENEAFGLSNQAEMNEAVTNQRDGKKAEELPKCISEKVMDSNVHVSGAQNIGKNAARANLQIEGCQYDDRNTSGQSNEHPNKSKRKVLKGSVKEGGQNLCGIRRHLQFESAKAHKFTVLGNSESPCSLTHHTTNLKSPSIPSNVKSLASSHFDNRASSSPQAVSCDTSQFASSPYESVRSAQIGVNSATSGPLHSGIGLHLNHIVCPTSMNSEIFSSKKSTGYLSRPEHIYLLKKESNDIAINSSSSLISAAVSGEVYSHVEAGISASQEADEVKELHQLSPQMKRKEADMGVGCKRCNCRRSKCLKLYCECFAAGVYCVDSCACVNCYNKPEFEDTVLDIRQQIESRNPLAFTPKVVESPIDSSANFKEEHNLTTPSSARHKRGCNCKKSKCLKKYCECFQAKVGCCSGCRCEGCQNTFGTQAESKAGMLEPHSSEKLDTGKGAIDCVKAANINYYSPTWEGLSDITNLTPFSLPRSRTGTSSASSSLRNSAQIPQAQLSSGARNDKTDDDTPEIFKENSQPTKVVNVISPNQKRASPQQSRSQLRSSSPTGLRSSRKFILHAVPSFPPLTPYRNSKEGSNEIGHDDKATNKNN